MKKIFLGIVMGLLLGAGIGQAGVAGDIDADGKITLTEAMGSLQVTSGTRVASYTSDNAYDTSEYRLGQTSGKKIWKQTEIGGNPVKIGIGVVSFSQETLNGQTVTAEKYESGMYAQFDLKSYSTETLFLGESESGMLRLYDPPVTKRINPWSPGQKINNLSVVKSDFSTRLEYREYELLGEEDVIVPAGTFKNCLKILSRRSFYQRHYIDYLAKGVGTVKSIRVNSEGGGYIWELMDIQKEDGTFLFEGNVCQITGIWKQDTTCPPEDMSCVDQGSFGMAYVKGDKNPNQLSLIRFQDYQYQNLSMITTDGITFLPDPSANWPDTNYDGTPDIPDISLTISNGTVTGSFNHKGAIITLNGTVSCP